MQQRLFLFCLLGTATFSTSANEDSAFPGLDQLMTAEEWQAAGIQKLNTDELKAFETWLIRYTARDASKLKQNNPVVKKVVKSAVTTRIAGQFNGWTGKTKFKLENGQIWQQRYGGAWKTNLNNPQVQIKRNFFGAYELKVVEADKSIGVKRIK